MPAAPERHSDAHSRHGFEDLEEVELVAGGPVHWLMWREPQG